ncbi:YopX family protein [Streptomyces sp. NPDC058469]|uniref:YopX family protein n=1 Tax=Streptomyces sp. NPDC058469 TaxID=3346514 RepID=UPI0036586F64
MAREIKFRAWDIGKSKMVQTNRHALNFDGTGVAYHQTAGRWNYLGSDSYQLMQYTGLKDKNGVEIYEDDIVEIKGSDRLGGFGTGYQRGVVEWDGFGFAIDRTLTGKKYGGHDLGFLRLELAVIGNIHQNPELLEANHGA